MIGRALVFLATFALLQLAWQLHATAALRNRYIHSGIVLPAAVIAQAFSPQRSVHAVGSRLREGYGRQGFSLNVVNGCDGTDMLFLVLAAFTVAPLAGTARLMGALIGVGVVYALNLLRVLALFYADGARPTLFDLLHGYLGPVVMVVLLVAYFHGWISRCSAPSDV